MEIIQKSQNFKLQSYVTSLIFGADWAINAWVERVWSVEHVFDGFGGLRGTAHLQNRKHIYFQYFWRFLKSFLCGSWDQYFKKSTQVFVFSLSWPYLTATGTCPNNETSADIMMIFVLCFEKHTIYLPKSPLPVLALLREIVLCILLVRMER